MKSTQGGTTVHFGRALGQLAGAVSALIAAGLTDEQIREVLERALSDGHELSDHA